MLNGDARTLVSDPLIKLFEFYSVSYARVFLSVFRNVLMIKTAFVSNCQFTFFSSALFVLQHKPYGL